MTNDHVNIKYNRSGEVIKTQKLLIKIPIRELNRNLIKPPSEGGFAKAISESGGVIIGYTSLRRYIPPQVKNE